MIRREKVRPSHPHPPQMRRGACRAHPRIECLESLRFDNTRFGKISKGHKGSFDWIWTHDEYKAWSIPNSSQLLYVQGKPGSGKSTLAKYFYNSLAAKQPAIDHAVVAKFFYSFREGERQTSHFNMLLTILYDILNQDESFFYHQFQSRYRNRKMASPRSHSQGCKRVTWDYESLKDLIRSLEDHYSKRPVYLIIDAVDESDREDRREILNILYGICASTENCTLKVFVASRPVANEPTRGGSHHHIVLQNETMTDIANFAGGFLKGLQSTHFMKPAIDYIVQNAQGVFLWVELVGAELVALAEGGYAARDIFVFLKELPKELEAFYAMMLQKIKRDKSNIRDGLKIFHFALFAARPLKGFELLHALGIPAEPNIDFDTSERSFQDCLPTDLTRRLINCTGNFLEIQPPVSDPVYSTVNMPKELGIVQVIHQTVREFFLDKDGCVAKSEFQIVGIDAHRCIAITCLRYLIFCIEGASMRGVQFWAEDVLCSYASYLQTRPFFCYTLEHLSFHLQHLKQDTLTLIAISTFLRKLDNTPATELLQTWANSVFHEFSSTSALPSFDTESGIRDKMLHAASREGFEIAVEILLLLGGEINAKDEEGLTPLWKAAENGHAPVVAVLMTKGADGNCQDSKKRTALSRAASNGHEAVVRRLADNVPHVPDLDQETPLSYAAANGHENVVRILIGGTRGTNALYRADPTATNNFRRTPLFQAAENGHEGVVLALIESESATNNFHQTLLSPVADNERQVVVIPPFESGSSLETKDIYDMTPLLRAAHNGHEAMVRLLIDHGASLHSKDTYGENPLFWAAQNGHEGVVNLLLEKGIASDGRDGDDRTPLSRAAGNGHLGVVRRLLQNGAAPDSLDAYKRSPLSWAAGRGHESIVELLLESNADIGSRDLGGASPLQWAANYHHVGIVNLLRQRGTRRNNRDVGHGHAHGPLITNRGSEEMTRLPAMERHDRTLYQQPINGGSISPAAGENNYVRRLATYRRSRSRRPHERTAIDLTHSPINRPLCTTSSCMVECDISDAGGPQKSHDPVDTVLELSSDEETVDSENATTPNANTTSTRSKRRCSLSRGDFPPPKRRQDEG
jgi:ankyrin repeat protein